MNLLKRVPTLIVSLTLLLCIGCEEEFKEQPQPAMPVTYTTIDGIWQLTEWNSEALAEGLYCYVCFNRSEQRFEMHDNLGSMYDNVTTGTFAIEQDEYERYILSGTYDYGVGDWNDAYVVTMDYTGSSMVWCSTSSSDTSTYTRVESMPEL